MASARAKAAARKALWDTLELVVVDTETTGLVGDVRVVSVALIEVVRGKVRVSSSWLVNPQTTRIGATHIHGLTASDLAEQPPFAELAPVISAHLRRDDGTPVILTGHNVGFDARVLAREFARCGKPCPPLLLLNTAVLAKSAGVATTDGKLDTLLAALGMSNPARHTALGDALLTAAATIELIGRLAELGIASVDDLLEPFDAKVARLPDARDREPLSDEHQAAHDADLTKPKRREEALTVCLNESCPDLASRLEDGVLTTDDARTVLAWAVAQARREDLARRLVGRLLGGISILIRRTEDPDLARATYDKLLPTLVRHGRCTTRKQCGRCKHQAGTCRFEQVRYALISAYLHATADPYEHPDLGQASQFLPLVATGIKRGRGRPPHGWYQQLIKAKELDAAGFGAVLAAQARRENNDRDWAQRTLAKAWSDGSRHPRLANTYASMLERGAAQEDKQHLKDALAVVEAALRVQRGRSGRAWAELEQRRSRLKKRIAAAPRAVPRSTTNQREPHRARFTR